jgi:hypothetical protein
MLALPIIQIRDFAAFIFAGLAQIKRVTKHIQKGTIFTRARNKAAPDILNFYGSVPCRRNQANIFSAV